MTTKIHADIGIEFPDGTVQGSAASEGRPVFSTVRTFDQPVSSGVATVALLDGTLINDNACYNPANGRFTPNVAGTYLIQGTINLGTSGGTTTGLVELWKNGSPYIRGGQFNDSIAGNTIALSVCAIVDLNGTTDYVQLGGAITGTSPMFLGAGVPPYLTSFSGFLIRKAP